MIAAGGLVAALCGTCTLAFIGRPTTSAALLIPLIIGGGPTAAGVVVAVWGVIMLRSAVRPVRTPKPRP
jgi:ABC-type branched-subunit amino acid transport system permease subunit